MATRSRHIGRRIRQRREEAGLSLNALALKAKVSKGYLWSLENGRTQGRPSGRTLYRLAEALGTTMSDLLGEELLSDENRKNKPSKSLRAFAEAEGLTTSDVEMLANVNFRGRQPKDRDGWALVWQAIRASVRGKS
jgi:transcriptional regulator with XRE-family HTH domain